MIHHYYKGIKALLNGIPADIDYDLGQLLQNRDQSVNRLPLILIKFNPITWNALPSSIQEADVYIDISIVTSDMYGNETSINNEITDHQPLCDAVFLALNSQTIRLSDYITNLPEGEDQIILNTLDRVNSTHPTLINNFLITTYRFSSHAIDCTAYISQIEADFDIVLEYALGNSPIGSNTVQQIRNLAFVLSNDNNANVVNFDPENPLSNVIFPQNVANGYAVRVKYLNGYGNFTLIQGVWVLNWFEPLSPLNAYLHIIVNSVFFNTYFPTESAYEGMNARVKFTNAYAIYTMTSNGWALNWYEPTLTLPTNFIKFIVAETNFGVFDVSTVPGSQGMGMRVKHPNGHSSHEHNGTTWVLKYFDALVTDTRHLNVQVNSNFDPAFDTSEITGQEGASMRIRFNDGYASYTYSVEWNLQWFESHSKIYMISVNQNWEVEHTNPYEFSEFQPQSILANFGTAIVDLLNAVAVYNYDFITNTWDFKLKIQKQQVVKTIICNLSQGSIGGAVTMDFIQNDFSIYGVTMFFESSLGEHVLLCDSQIWTYGKTRVSITDCPNRIVNAAYFQSDEIRISVRDNNFIPVDEFQNVMLTIEVFP